MLRLSEGHGANAAALCDAGAVGALAGVVLKGSGEARKTFAAATEGAISELFKHSKNQSAAAVQGAIPLLVQLTKSSDADLQKRAVETIGLVVKNHSHNQTAAAAEGAIPLLVQLIKSSDAELQKRAVETLRALVHNHAKNQSNPDFLVANLDAYTPSSLSYLPAPGHAPHCFSPRFSPHTPAPPPLPSRPVSAASSWTPVQLR